MATTVNPTRLRLEVSSACQLRCPSCPTHAGEAPHTAVGTGFLRLVDFINLIDHNPQIQQVELSNYGEILLNPDLVGILRHAHDRGVTLTADNGVNLNRASDEVLEALVTYRLRSMTCSIDGASPETYSVYRVRGDYDRVIANLRRLNEFKRAHNSEYPRLTWQFVVFGHNEHEIADARFLAHSLGMQFSPKLSWDPDFSPVRDRDAVRAAIGAADRAEYEQRHGPYIPRLCHELWDSPQVNWDGRVLGCSRNFWGDFGANAFREGLRPAINNADMRYARQMLLGHQPPRPGIPCTTCSVYEEMRESGHFLERRSWNASPRMRASVPYRAARRIYRVARRGYRAVRGGEWRRPPLLNSQVAPSAIPPDRGTGFTSLDIVAGTTKGLRTWTCHASSLTTGSCPHPPHRHVEEEVLLVLAGEVEVWLPDAASAGGPDRVRLSRGQFAYYPANFAHTLIGTSGETASYLMFKWAAGQGPRRRRPIPHGIFSPQELHPEERSPGFATAVALHGPTMHLGALHCHATTLQPGHGYEAHSDPYDVAIIVLEGEVETLGERIGPNGVVFCAAGEPHGMHNPGDAPARYLVFEFHSRETVVRSALRKGRAAIVSALP